MLKSPIRRIPGNIQRRGLITPGDLVPSGGVILPWWNIDGLTPGGPGGTCPAAYQSKQGSARLDFLSVQRNMAAIGDSYLNLANWPNYNAQNGVAPAWALNTGWTFDGLAQYLLTGLPGMGVVPGINRTWSAICWYENAVTVDGALFGSYDGGFTTYYWVLPRTAAAAVNYANCGPLAVPGIQATGSAGWGGSVAYRNGVPEAGAIPNGGNAPFEVYLGCLNFANAARVNYLNVVLKAIAFYSVVLNPAQFLARHNALVAQVG